MTPALFRKLAALGLSNDQMAGVLEIFEEDAEQRKAKARARVQKHREKKQAETLRNVTERYVTERNATCDLARVEDNNLNNIPTGKNNKKTTPKGESKNSLANDVSEAYEAYQNTAKSAGFPVSRQFSPDRQQKLRRALNEFGLSGWREALELATKSPFCRGENDRGWRVDLDFLLQPKSLRRLLEGRYSGQPKSRAPPRGETVAESAIRDLEKLRHEQPPRKTDRPPALPGSDGRYPGGISSHVVAAVAAKR